MKTALIFALVATLLGCQKAPSGDAAPATGARPTRVTVAYTVQPQSTLIHVAVAKGYFAEEGLDVQPSIHTHGRASLQSLIEHKADFATTAETPFMFNVLKGEKIFVIANIEASSVNNGIVARKDAGITKAGQLRGKRIGFTPGTTSDFFLDSLLTALGLTRQEIQPVPLKPEEMQDAILAKRIDAASTWNYPLTEIKHALGANGTIFVDREIYTETFNVAAQQDFVRQNPETVQRFLRALIKAEKFVAKNRDEAQQILNAATKTDIHLIREVWEAFSYRIVLDQTLLITLEDETRWAMKNKLTDKTAMPNYLDFIHIDSLKSVDPNAILLHR